MNIADVLRPLSGLMASPTGKDPAMAVDERRKKYLIAKALWEFVAQDGSKPIERQCRNDVHDMEAILDGDYPNELSLLMKAERFKDRPSE
jgi:hypothetical protein